MKDAFIGIASILGMLVLVGVLVYVLRNLDVRGESQFDRITSEFNQACTSVNGKTVWNGRNWECLK